MATTTIIDLLEVGFFIGLGWYLAKAIFVILISIFVVKRPIKLDTED